jgi:hypothetical protein
MTSPNPAAFTASWTARILTAPPLIAPARQFIYPQFVPGEEDAMNRGALLLDIKPATAPNLPTAGGNFLATCALGFRDPSLPTGIFPCPRPEDLLALAGGYAYLIDTASPGHSLHIPLRPVTQILAAPLANLVLLAGFHQILAIGPTGIAWQSARLSWEGVTMLELRDHLLHGTGWNMHTDREVPFTVDLATGSHTGGGFAL